MSTRTRTFLGTLACFALLWSVSIWIWDPSEQLFPSPWTTAMVFCREPACWGPHAWATGQMLVLCLGLGVLLAVPIAYAMQRYGSFRTWMESLFLLVQCLPLFIFVPVLVAILGWGVATVLIPSLMAVLLPLCMSLHRGLLAVPQAYLELYGTYSFSPWGLFWAVQLPHALPSLLAGLRMGVATAGSAVLAAEFAGGQEGLGLLIQESRRNFDLTMAFGGILSVGLLLGILVGLTHLLEEFLLRGRRHAAI
jgi:ABC-type nitrate/sulfonate/bicarbonate transport system permease component